MGGKRTLVLAPMVWEILDFHRWIGMAEVEALKLIGSGPCVPRAHCVAVLLSHDGNPTLPTDSARNGVASQ